MIIPIEENKATVYVDDYRSPFERLNAILAAMLGEEEPVAVFVPVSSKVASSALIGRVFRLSG